MASKSCKKKNSIQREIVRNACVASIKSMTQAFKALGKIFQVWFMSNKNKKKFLKNFKKKFKKLKKIKKNFADLSAFPKDFT